MNISKLRVFLDKFKIVYFAVLVGVALYYFLKYWNEFYKLATTARIEVIGLVFLLGCCVVVIYILIHYFIYRGMAVRVSFVDVFSIVSLSALGKYLPGKIWVAANYYALSRKAKIKSEDIGTSFIISWSLLFLTGGVCIVPVISFLPAMSKFLIPILLAIFALAIHPKVLKWAVFLLHNVIRKYLKLGQENYAEASNQPGYLLYVEVILLYAVHWLIAGVAVYLAIYAFRPVQTISFPVCVAAYALAAIGGHIVFFVPAGLGVREGIGAFVLAPMINMDFAVLVMVLVRIVGLVVELSFALAAIVLVGLATQSDGSTDSLQKNTYGEKEH